MSDEEPDPVSGTPGPRVSHACGDNRQALPGGACGRPRKMLLDMLRNLLEPEFRSDRGCSGRFGVARNRLASTAGHRLGRYNNAEIEWPGRWSEDLAACAPAIRIVYLTMEADEVLAAEAFTNGAFGYLLKANSTAELMRAMRLAANSRRYLTSAIANGDVDALCRTYSASPVARLSDREVEVS